MRKTTKIRVLTFSLALLALTGGFWLDSRLSLQAAETRLEYVYRRSLGDLTDYVSGMQDTLHKAMYTGTASTQSATAAQLLEQSGGAKAALAALPFSQERTDRVSRFLSQAGDYGLALSRKAFRGTPLDRADLEGLASLREYAGKLSQALSGLQARLTAEGDDITQTVHLLNNVGELEELTPLDDGFDAVAEEFSAFPSLLYDGPFSDHLARREPLFVKGQEAFTQDQAAEAAAGFLGCSPQELDSAGQGGGQLPVYAFTWEDAMANVTVQGGQLSYYKKSHTRPTAKLGYDQALEAARDFLDQAGFPELQESYYVQNDGLCTINFHGTAETTDGQPVLCYPDLVKVVLELEEGGTVELDCAGWLMNRHTRRLDPPQLTQEQAQGNISPWLQADSGRLALIPTPGLDEVLCWELHCTAADSTEVLSYINCETGAEEQLYILQRGDNGVLAL